MTNDKKKRIKDLETVVMLQKENIDGLKLQITSLEARIRRLELLQ